MTSCMKYLLNILDEKICNILHLRNFKQIFRDGLVRSVLLFLRQVISL